MPNNDGSETLEEYWQRIKAVPGIFSDRNESAHSVVHRAEELLHEAEDLEKKTHLAPAAHPEEDRPEVVKDPQNDWHVQAAQVPGFQPQPEADETPEVISEETEPEITTPEDPKDDSDPEKTEVPELDPTEYPLEGSTEE